jgi:hypothetical protein
MKRILIILSFIVFFSGCKGNAQEIKSVNVEMAEQSDVLLDTLITLAKKNSYYSSKVNWTKLEDEMITISKKNDSIDKLGKPAELMFKRLGDYHGMLMFDYKVAFNHRSENSGPPNDSIYKSIGATKINSPYEVNATIIEKNEIAYIEIPATGVMQAEQIKYAINEIRNAICALKKEKPTGWIIDLRCNIGGNMNPMLAGLAELIPNANLGGDTKDGTNFYSKWSFEEGNFYENGQSNYKTDLKCGHLSNTNRIAVLTSKYTASAGEVVASSLKGQENVKVIGQKTSGLSSTNGWFVLSDKWIFAPMTAYYMSKDKTVHNDGIVPDIAINENLDLNDLLNGTVVDRAVQWIKMGE